MTWQRRKKQRYLYRSYRSGGQVQKEYLGRGPFAELRAQIDDLQRQEREQERADRKQAEAEAAAELAAQEAPVLELAELADLAARAALLRAGCHKHKGEWRRGKQDAGTR